MTDETNNDDDEYSGFNSTSVTMMSDLYQSLLRYDTSDFGSSQTRELSDDMELAIEVMQSAKTLDELADHIDDSDAEWTELSEQELMSMDVDKANVVYAFLSLSKSMQKLGEALEDDDDDSPFRVGGDGPIR